MKHMDFNGFSFLSNSTRNMYDDIKVPESHSALTLLAVTET